MNHLEKLPEGCISEILSWTSAADASRSSAVSKLFKLAAESDTVWTRFLPEDWEEMVSRVVSAVPKYATRKDLFLGLSNNSLLIDGPNLSFSIDRRNGKKCYMVGARQLQISWKSCWDFVSHSKSRFAEVARLKSIGWIHIQGKIRSQALSPNTTYAAYLVYWLDNKDGLRSSNTIVRFLNDQPKHNMSNEHLESQETGKLAQNRDDGWMEMEMGKFNSDNRYDEVEVWLIEINNPHGKAGLIVQGIEFRSV